MPEKVIGDLFKIGSRFLRSTHLERDFKDPTVLSGYVMTDFTRSCLGRVASGLKPSSGQRAWRMTGDYGSGKSTFALLLAHWFAGRDNGLSSQIRNIVGAHQNNVSRPHFVPVLVTCSRQSLGRSILNAMYRTITEIYGRGAKLKLALEVQGLLEAKHEPTEEEVLRLVLEFNSRIIADSKGKGLLLILDELGKFLEFAALHPGQQDVFLLQCLAESASRSGDKPLFVVSLLHQGFNAYADQLNQSAQREWEKVAGRFEEIVFDQPVEQIANLIASALNVKTAEIPKLQSFELRQAMERTVGLGWFGSAPAKSLSDLATRLYPLHPTVPPILIRAFRRFGQNERSLFSFLVSNEPFGLQAFSGKHLCEGDLYRLHDFYDYVRTNFGHRIAAQSYRSHWNLIDSVIESFATEDEVQIKILKTVGILNLINDGDLMPTEESLICALAGTDQVETKRVHATLEKLHKGKRVLYDRGRARGLCLWPHTSVDLEKAYEDARRVIGTPERVADIIKDFLESRPIVARRHYIETGNLRYWNVRYCSVKELPSILSQNSIDADGLIIVPLCETPTEHAAALELVKQPLLKQRSNWLVAVPRPLNNLASLVQEVQRWEWVSMNTLELNADKFAREEVSRQKAAARQQLEKRIQSYISFKQRTGQMTLEWFHEGRPLKVTDGRELLSVLSRIFSKTFAFAPRIHNELINRRSLSSSAAAARMRLIKLMFMNPGAELLGMSPTKAPPEMSIYLSVLKNTGLHQKHGNTWRIGEPHYKTDEKCGVLPALRRIREIVKSEPDSRVNIAALFAELHLPPYGLRDGLIPLLLTVFAITHEKDVAFYKDGTFLRELNGEAMLVLTKAPERFEIQYCKIEGVRAELFERLLTVLEVKSPEERKIELLDVVKKLCVFVAQLPTYVLNTKRLHSSALAVRDVVLNAREPTKLLFTELPKACSFQPIPADATASKTVQAFVKTLKSALDELRAAYPELEGRLRNQLRSAFDLPGTFQQFRTALAARSEQILLAVTEPKLRAFCLRLMDDKLPEAEWLESIGSYLALKPPSKWHDVEEDVFTNELIQYATRFHRVESIAFAGSKSSVNTIGLRLAITQADGVEYEKVVHFTASEEQHLRDLQGQFETLLAKDKRLGLAAASRAIWANLAKEGK
ncbi:MAG: hypothetical protein HOP35_11395, partial [Nitrospira sp.]|nr:hypothetical protein [Nitrospira sp.]